MKRFFWLLPLVGACHSAVVPEVKQPDGSWHLSCGSSLAKCADRADTLCGGRGYVVLGGTSRRTMYGAADGISQVEKREADLTIACADHHDELPKVLVTNGVAPPPAVAVAPSAPPAKTSACTPGATQQCVGAGACAGGQACLPDGSGFSPCDCGGASKAAAAPTGS